MATEQQQQQQQPATLTVGLAGLTSKLLRLVARLLLARHPHVRIRGLVRDRTRVPADIASHPRVAALVEGAAGDAATADAFAAGCDVVLCGWLTVSADAAAAGALLVEGQRVLIDACERAGVRRFFPSDWTMDHTRLAPGDVAPKDPAVLTRRYLEQQRARGARLRAVHVLNMAFTETILSTYFQVWHGEERRLAVWAGLDLDLWELTTYRTAAEYTVELILDENADGVFRFLGEKTTARGMATALEDVYDIKPELVLLGSLKELGQKMRAARREGDPSWIAMSYQHAMMDGKASLGPVEAMDNRRYPNVKPESLRDFLRRTPLEELNDAYSKTGDYQWEDESWTTAKI